MTQKSNLETLLAKVKSGEARYMSEYFRVSDILGTENAGNAWSANRGSLDAAHSLHKAVLPTYTLYDMNNVANVWGVIMSNGKQQEHLRIETSGTHGDNPARAWLIAIIKALIAECE